MAFVEHHRLHIRQRVIGLISLRIKHVAEDLRGHHHDRSLTVHAEVTGHQTDVVGSKLLTEVAQLLIGKGLERRGVKHLLAMGDGSVDGVFTHEGLAGSRWGAHHNGMPLIEGINRLQLEVIQREGEELRRIRGSHTGGL